MILIGVIFFALFAYCYYEAITFHLAYGYGRLGYPAAQHVTGQRYLIGHGVKNRISRCDEITR